VCLHKWHQGFHTPFYLPVGRGFNTSYGFLAGGEDHFTQTTTKCDWGHVTDYWASGAPAASCDVPPADRQPCPQWTVEQNKSNATTADAICAGDAAAGDGLRHTAGATSCAAGSGGYANCAWDSSARRCFQCKPKRYTGFDFTAHSVGLIEKHDPKVPLFLYLALHNTHGPIEAPAEFEALYRSVRPSVRPPVFRPFLRASLARSDRVCAHAHHALTPRSHTTLHVRSRTWTASRSKSRTSSMAWSPWWIRRWPT
jgi:hypothetical protein